MGDPHFMAQVIEAMPEFKPGFRFSSLDACIIGAGAVGSFIAWQRSWWIGFVIAFVVLHFFLFCNVFRTSRRLELTWALIFIILTRSTVGSGFPSWTLTILLSLAVTIVVVGIETRKPSYHGIGWNLVNPNLREWWDASMNLKNEV